LASAAKNGKRIAGRLKRFAEIKSDFMARQKTVWAFSDRPANSGRGFRRGRQGDAEGTTACEDGVLSGMAPWNS